MKGEITMKNFTAEMIEKAKAAKNAEELLIIAKENNVEMTAYEAKTLFEQMNPKSGELDDDELDTVAGGGCDDPLNKQLFPEGSHVRCTYGNCKTCGTNEWKVIYEFHPVMDGKWMTVECVSCGRRQGGYRQNGTDMPSHYELI